MTKYINVMKKKIDEKKESEKQYPPVDLKMHQGKGCKFKLEIVFG